MAAALEQELAGLNKQNGSAIGRSSSFPNNPVKAQPRRARRADDVRR
jgi:hypothetical protein